MEQPERIGRALVLALALAGGCRDDADPARPEASPTSSGDAPEPGGTTQGTTTPGDSTGGTAAGTGADTSASGTTEGTSSSGGDPSGTSSSGDTSRGGTSSSSGDPSGTSSSGGDPSGTSSSGETSRGGTETGSGDTGPDTGPDTDGSDTGEPSECAFSESFDGLPDGSDWPAPWEPIGGVALADVQDGRGRLLPVTGPYALARMFVPLPPTCVDLEGTFTFELADDESSGVGLYLRHNGGFLDQTQPPGQGYNAFAQAFGLSTGISVWRELGGVETVLAPFTPQIILPNTVYKVRFRVTQQDADTTRLRARVWLIEGIEPMVWHVDLTDQAPGLQGAGGGLCIDVWSQLEMGVAADVLVDDIVVGPAP